MDNLQKQAEEKYGNTKEYKEFKEKNNTETQNKKSGIELMDIFKKLGALKHLSPEDEQVQALINELQQHISIRYYTCSDEMLFKLANLYVTEAFKVNIDREAGEGTANFTLEAIKVYCNR